MPLERLEDEPRQPLRLHVVPEAAPPAPRAPRPPIDEQVLQVISALSAVLAVRAIMALAVIGAGLLAYLAITATADRAIWVFGLYTVTVLGPLIWLAQRRT